MNFNIHPVNMVFPHITDGEEQNGLSANSAIVQLFLEANHSVFQMFKEQFERPPPATRYLLNVECTQFPIGKTGKTLDHIAARNKSLLNAAKVHMLNSHDTNNYHTISIIISSCNLAETAQWAERIEKYFGKKLNITTISSKTKKTKGGSGTGIENFSHALAVLAENKLPNILLMCCHSKRVNDDIIELLKASKRIILESGRRFRYNIFIDEADKNIKLVTKALKKIKGEQLEKHIDEIHFITATPTKPFWKALKKTGIKKLDNIDIEFGEKISKETRELAENRYQSILTNSFTGVDHITTDPLDYIKHVLSPDLGLIKPWRSERKILFVPGDRSIITHWAIADYFLDAGYWVFLHNGNYKGFLNPIGKVRIPLEKFMEQNNLIDKKTGKKKVELMQVFALWNIQNPTASLAITGLTTIVRGLTFNTTGFNFTHMIFSVCHTNNLADFIQLLGRACGHRLFCDNIRIIGLSQPFKQAKEFVKHILELKREDDVIYTQDSFELDKQNKDVIIYPDFKKGEKGKTRKQIIAYIKKEFGTQAKPKANQIQNEQCFYENIIRYVKKVWNYDDVYKQRGCGLGSTTKRYRIHVCYTDVNDKTTETWCCCYKRDNVSTSSDEDKVQNCSETVQS